MKVKRSESGQARVDKLNETLGEVMKDARKERKVTQSSLATKMNKRGYDVKRQRISWCESGKGATLDTVVSTCQGLDMSPHQFATLMKSLYKQLS